MTTRTDNQATPSTTWTPDGDTGVILLAWGSGAGEYISRGANTGEDIVVSLGEDGTIWSDSQSTPSTIWS